MTKARHVLSSIALLLVLLLWYSPIPMHGQSQAQQVVSDAADALGGRDRVLAVKTLLLEGEGKEFSFGQGSSWTEMGQEASVWKVMGYRRAYDLTGSRARFEQSRTPLYAFFAGTYQANPPRRLTGTSPSTSVETARQPACGVNGRSPTSASNTIAIR